LFLNRQINAMRVLPLAALLFLTLQTDAAAHSKETLFTSTHPAMGTIYELHLYARTANDAEHISDAVWEEVDRLDTLLSNYKEESELSRINAQAARTPVTTDPETFRLLAEAQHWSRVSDGAFDMTVGALMRGWGFFRSSGRVPTPEQIASLRERTGWQKMQLDAGTRSVSFTRAGLELDPGGIGKGFAVDAAVDLLRQNGVHAAMVSAGSSTLYALGSPPGKRGWRVIVPDPQHTSETISTIELRDASLSTANCTEKNFVLDGHLYCHIMNPHTLRPVEGRVQVTVLYPQATASDALSNVLFVKEPEQGRTFLASNARIAHALVISNASHGYHCTTYQWHAPVSSACTTQ
jgi:thiamine biosynthesis lipoprotein